MNQTTTPAALDLAKLEALARAATPGEWTAMKHGRIVGGPLRHYVNGSTQQQIAMFNVTAHEEDGEDVPERQQANTEFVAAFDPPTAQALIDLARRSSSDATVINYGTPAASAQPVAAAPADGVRDAILTGAHAEFSESLPPGSLTSLGHRHVVSALRAAIKFYIGHAAPAAPVAQATTASASGASRKFDLTDYSKPVVYSNGTGRAPAPSREAAPLDYRKVLVDVRNSLQFANDNPGGGIVDTLWMMDAPETIFDHIDAALAQQGASQDAAANGGAKPELTVWEGAMPESNGRQNYTAVLHRKDSKGFDLFTDGFQFQRSEHPDRTRYEADFMRWLIGEREVKPELWDDCYDFDKHSGYVKPAATSAGASQGQAGADDARDAAWYRWVEENCRTEGGGHGFTVFVPVDEEDIGCGIDAAIAATTAKESSAKAGAERGEA